MSAGRPGGLVVAVDQPDQRRGLLCAPQRALQVGLAGQVVGDEDQRPRPVAHRVGGHQGQFHRWRRGSTAAALQMQGSGQFAGWNKADFSVDVVDLDAAALAAAYARQWCDWPQWTMDTVAGMPKA